ncbi:hypothetical protein ACS0TY_029448 [Phlomoides rotata]
MLQRAASNAYSWWWASHIRTKQSKWLEQSLQDMDERVQGMLKLIQEDGDSFAKRAEMYYKRRPELISAVEEAYKQFRSLADRYDLMSRELQNVNHTIATVFPEQVQFAMPEEGDAPTPVPPKPQIPSAAGNEVPQAPKEPIKELKKIISKASKQYQEKKSLKAQKTKVKSGLTKEEALEEISKLQKDILAQQTVKEFVKSSYESGVAKYWGIESQIMEMQQKVSSYQDEFDLDSVIEDDEARTLMAEAALKSCQETLALLEEKQEKSSIDAKVEYKRIESAYQRLQSLRQKYLLKDSDGEATKAGDNSQNLSKDVDDFINETKEIEDVPEKSEESLELSCLTVSQLAEKIDQLVNKVITLETAVSSHTVLVNTLRSETDDLNAQIQDLEEENESLVDETQCLNTRVKEVEDKLNKVQDLNKNVESRNSRLQTNFAQARTNLDHLSEKLSSVKVDEEPEAPHTNPDHHLPSSVRSVEGHADEKPEVEEIKEVSVDVQFTEEDDKQVQAKKAVRKVGSFLDRKQNEHVPNDSSEKHEEVNWQQLLLNGMEDGEKILLKEYTTILRNYKDVKKKLAEAEKKERDKQFDITLQMRELKKSIQTRDKEIKHLRRKINNEGDEEEVKEETTLSSLLVLDANGDVSITNEDTDSKLVFIDRSPSISIVEEKLRSDIDGILDENLDFWLRFSTAYHQVQKFKTEVKDLEDEISKVKEKHKPTSEMKPEVLPIYKHLREIQRELGVWSAQSVPLKDELKSRFASLCTIQEEITQALREGAEEDEIKFSSHQAAKLQGEVLNMKQENNKVREELQAALDHVSILQLQIDKTLSKLNEELGISSDQPEHSNRNRVPLRSFIFGTKPKKQKHSIFSIMHPNKKYQILRAGIRLSNRTS